MCQQLRHKHSSKLLAATSGDPWSNCCFQSSWTSSRSWTEEVWGRPPASTGAADQRWKVERLGLFSWFTVLDVFLLIKENTDIEKSFIEYGGDLWRRSWDLLKHQNVRNIWSKLVPLMLWSFGARRPIIFINNHSNMRLKGERRWRTWERHMLSFVKISQRRDVHEKRRRTAVQPQSSSGFSDLVSPGRFWFCPHISSQHWSLLMTEVTWSLLVQLSSTIIKQLSLKKVGFVERKSPF